MQTSFLLSFLKLCIKFSENLLESCKLPVYNFLILLSAAHTSHITVTQRTLPVLSLILVMPFIWGVQPQITGGTHLSCLYSLLQSGTFLSFDLTVFTVEFLKGKGLSLGRMSLNVGLSSDSTSLNPGYTFCLKYHRSDTKFSLHLGWHRDIDLPP